MENAPMRLTDDVAAKPRVFHRAEIPENRLRSRTIFSGKSDETTSVVRASR
jgi:hypothetical protein